VRKRQKERHSQKEIKRERGKWEKKLEEKSETDLSPFRNSVSRAEV
jgi:hypothetical protein